jgi:hypothetical protein
MSTNTKRAGTSRHMKIFGLDIMIKKTAYYTYLGFIFFPFTIMVVYTALFQTSTLNVGFLLYALFVGVCFTLYHNVVQFLHQLGHAFAARYTGYPMTGIRYEYVFSYSLYPKNEPLLSDRVHMIRSFGGFIVATLITVSVAVLSLNWSAHATDDGHWLLHFILFDSAILFIGGIMEDGRFTLQKLRSHLRGE